MVDPIILGIIFSRAGSKLVRIRAARNPNPPESSSSGRAKLRRRQTEATSLSSHPHTSTEHRCSRGNTRPLNPAGLFASMAPTRQKKRSNLSVLEPSSPTFFLCSAGAVAPAFASGIFRPRPERSRRRSEPSPLQSAAESRAGTRMKR
jgi:hypothetical protein